MKQRSTSLIIRAHDKEVFWVYMLLCENGSYYTGYTTDIKKRYQSHLNGSGGCKYTRSFKPVKIAQCWKITGSKSLALRLEKQIKKLSRDDKNKIINHPDLLCIDSHISVYSNSVIPSSTSSDEI